MVCNFCEDGIISVGWVYPTSDACLPVNVWNQPRFYSVYPEAYSEPCKTSNTEFFLKQLTAFTHQLYLQNTPS